MHTQSDTTPLLQAPQPLVKTQEQADPDHVLCAPVRLDRFGVLDGKTQLPVFTMTIESVRGKRFLLGSHLISVTRSDSNVANGSIHLRPSISAICPLTINGHYTI
jgi:hypothetical protein